LTKRAWSGVDLRSLIREQLLIDPVNDPHIAISGPSVEIDPQAAVHLGLVLHELGTNARKYGALSSRSGQLSVTWRLDNADAGNVLCLDWEERGGPVVEPPTTQGFGTLLVSRGITHTLRGRVRHDFAPGGVKCQICFPIRDENNKKRLPV
jgi:two-component system, chemotaxis family, CheB/CheR fusion protein